jgi:hypothetical protein
MRRHLYTTRLFTAAEHPLMVGCTGDESGDGRVHRL